MESYLELVQGMLRAKKEASAHGHLLDGQSLTLGSLLAISRDKAKASASDKQEVLDNINEGVLHLNQRLQKGDLIYGVNTGYGGSADTVTDKVECLQTSLLNLLSVGFRGPLADDTTRGTVCLRANSAIRGHSAVRLSIIEDLCTLLNNDVLPLIPKRGSVSASGDLVPLAYLAAFLEGKDYAQGSVEVMGPNDKPTREVKTAVEALKHAGLAPQKLQPKEVLAIVNGTSASTAEAGLVIADTHVLMLLSQAVTALNVEVMKGSKESFNSFIHQSRPHRGQIEVAENILKMLEPSKLVEDFDQAEQGVKPGLRQDRYSLRTSPQWIGPQLETVQIAHKTIEIELNSTTDNPIMDPKTGKIYHGGNFQATSLAVSMENVRIAIQHVAKLIYAQHLEVVNKDMNKGLPANLAFSPPSLDYGMKGVEISMASYMTELSYVSNTVTNHVHSTDLHNQNVNSVALISARATKKAVKICQMMFAAHIYALLQAADLRVRDIVFFKKLAQGLSVWLQEVFDNIFEKAENNEEVVKALKERLIRIACLLCQENQNLDPEARFTKAFNVLFGELFDAVSQLNHNAINLKNLKTYKQKMIESTLAIFDETNEVFIDEASVESYLGKTSHLYRYFREEKGLKLNRGTIKDKSHGETISKIFEAISSWDVVPTLLRCFEDESQ